VGRAGQADLHLVEAASGEIDAMAIPDGVPSERWRRVVTATAAGGATVVRDEIVQPGFGGPEFQLEGTWRLPSVGLDPVPVGRSVDGSTIVLVEPPDATPGRSRFAVLQHWLMDAVQTAGDAPFRLARIVDLAGEFDYDALSPDGRRLYVVQHLEAAAGGHYQVRVVDVASGVMDAAVIVDKANPGESMAGSPIAQLRRADGVVLTLYRGPEHPFIHALNSKDAWAFCIDLPSTSAAATGTELAARRDWGLAESADGSAVYSVNASLGLAVDIDPSDLAIRRTATIGTTAGSGRSGIVLAKFGHADVGPVGRRLAATPDGDLLFAASGTGLTVIRRDLTVAVEAVGITPDGATVFALLADGRIAAIDAASGANLGAVPGGGFDRLLAVAPW
jgi:hypothetical protein